VTARTIRIWSLVHKWTSLVSTLFLLLLCLTGLPLIFHHEIEELTGSAAAPAAVAAGTPKADLDRIAAAAAATKPGHVVQYLYWEKDEPGVVGAIINTAAAADPNASTTLLLDAHTGGVLGPTGGGVMLVILRLHVDLFAGVPGKLFLGGMGFLMLVAIVSGVVLYAPFMRRLDFGTVRASRSPRTRWLDLHNLLGVVTVFWALVVGGTGVLNTWADLMMDRWRATEVAPMIAAYSGRASTARLAPLDGVVTVARRAAPGMVPGFIAFPGTSFSSPHHYAVFMRGETPLTAKLLKPVLVDAETGALTEARDLPWYLTALLVSQPLHFGDYAGLPLKILWALLDIVTIFVLGSGLYLWWGKRRVVGHARASLREPAPVPTARVA
jgi:uncharacterized iron-regulated membrane protein